MAVMMPNQSYPDAVRQLPVEKMVRKPFQVGPMEARLERVKSSGVCCGSLDYLTQFFFELLAQPV